jgi:hypothetical protein
MTSMSKAGQAGFVVKANLDGGLSAWIKRQAGPYRIGPREQASVFVDRGTAQASISQLPETIQRSATFSIQIIGDEN